MKKLKKSVDAIRQSPFAKTVYSFLAGLSFLFLLIVVAPLVVEKIFSNTENSVHTTRYILIGYFGFFLVVTGIIFPIMRRMKAGVDNLATVLLCMVSAFPLLLLCLITNAVMLNKKFKYKYRFINYVSAVAIFLLGVWVGFFGKRDKRAPWVIYNHTSPLDYPFYMLIMGAVPFNIVAGENLWFNKKGLFNWFIAWTIGNLVKNYSISVDRDSYTSRKQVPDKMERERELGKDVGIAPEGGRTPFEELMQGTILRKFKSTVFELAWQRKEAIQPVVLDFPAIWKGKDDSRFGIHPCTVNIHYLKIVHPSDFSNEEAFNAHCWNKIFEKLASSRKVKSFLENRKQSLKKAI